MRAALGGALLERPKFAQMTNISPGTVLAPFLSMNVLPVLERTPALAGVEPEILRELARAAETVTLKRGARLWQAGDPPRAFTVLRSGLVKTVRRAPRGRTAICGLFAAPSSIGDVALLNAMPHPVDAIVASEQATLITVPEAVLLDCAKHSKQLGVSLARAFRTQLAALHDKVDVLSAGPVEARLATLLLKLYERFGDDFDDGTSRIPIALSRHELADLVATSFETAIRVMSRWERQGVVLTDAHGFTVRDLDFLHGVIGETVPTESVA